MSQQNLNASAPDLDGLVPVDGTIKPIAAPQESLGDLTPVDGTLKAIAPAAEEHSLQTRGSQDFLAGVPSATSIGPVPKGPKHPLDEALGLPSPTEVGNWFDQVSGDVKTGSATTWVGSLLHKMGAKGTSYGVPESVGTLMAGPVAGLPEVGKGVTMIGEHPVQAANKIISGVGTSLGAAAMLTPEAIPFVASASAGSKIASGVAEKMGADEDTQELVGNIVGLAVAGKAIKKAHVENFGAAVDAHLNAQKTYDTRVKEVSIATDQASESARAAIDARAAAADGTGTREQAIAAQNLASEAAANAKKAQTALKEAQIAKTETGVKLGKVGRDITKAANTPTVNAKDSAAAWEDFQKATPPSKMTPYSKEDYEIGRRYTEHHHENVENVTSVQGQYDALDASQKEIENKVRGMVQRYAKEPILSNVKMDVADALAAQDKIVPGFMDKGLNDLSRFNLTDPTMEEADQIRAQLNAENRAILKKNMWDVATALKVDPEFAARYAAQDSLRNGIYDQLTSKDVTGAREARRDESAIIRLRNATDRQLLKGDAKVRGSGQSGAIRKSLAKSSTVLGTIAGGGLGAGIGGVVGAEIGAPLGAFAGSKIGEIISPADITRNDLVARHMSKKVATAPPTEVVGRGTPSTPPVEPMPPVPGSNMSAKDIQQIQREFSPLHSELATHYGESVGASSYGDLEQRFMEDIADKQHHGATLEPAEKTLLGKINQQNASEQLKAQQVAAEAAAKGEPLVKQPTLPDGAQPVMPIKGNMPNSMSTPEGLVHDLAHAVVGQEKGLPAIEIRSHLHPENVKNGSLVSAAFDWSDFIDEDGKFNFNTMKTRMPDIAATYVAGGVANDLYHGIPFTENHGLGADMDVLHSFMKAAGFSDAEASQLIKQAADDAAEILSRPNMQEMLEAHSQVREPGLDEKLHFSPERLQQILKDVQEGPNEITEGDTAGATAEGDGAAAKAGAGTEDAVQELADKAVRKEAKGSSKGKTEEPGNPKLTATAVQGGHAGGGVASEEELARPGRFVKIGRSGMPTDQGKVPDFNLQIGEAGYQVKPDGTYELKSGQETPTTKRGVQGYARQVYPESSNPKLSSAVAEPETERLPKVENFRVPPERTTGKYDEAIKQGGAVPGGIQKGDPEIGIPDLALFHDPTTGSTLALPADKITSELVKQHLRKSRDQYIAAEDRKAAANKPLEERALRNAADEFNKQHGRPSINTAPVGEDPRSSAVADAYKAATHAPNDPAVKRSYDALKHDIDEQYDLAKKLGIKTDVKDENPYGLNSEIPAHEELHNDVRNNKHLSVWSGGAPPADHPLSEIDPKTGLTYNDKFRMVHDIFGHAAERQDFSPSGEETAWNLHRQMFSPEARPALATETKGQAAYTYKYGDFPPQKAALLPSEFHARPEDLTWHDKAGARAASEPAGGLDPYTGHSATEGIGTEIIPEARMPLDHPPTAEDFKKFRDQHEHLFQTHPELKIGWDNNSNVPGGHELNIGAVGPNAAEVARKLGQRAAFDIAKREEIPTGGSGTKTDFPGYPIEQRLAELNKKVAAYHPDLQKLADKFGTSTDASKVKDGASFIAPDGKFIHLGSTEHPVAIESLTDRGGDPEAVGAKVARSENSEIFDPATQKFTPVDNRIGFMRDTGAIRTRFRQSIAGKELVASVPASGVTPDQIRSLRQAVGQVGHNGNFLVEVGESGGKSATKEFASPRDVGPMLQDIGAFSPEQANPKLSKAQQDEPAGIHEDDVPRGSKTPDVNWQEQDLQDTAKTVNEETIAKDYGPKRKGAKVSVYKSYIPMEDLPSAKIVEEEETDPELNNENWREQYQGLLRRPTPPIKVRVNPEGKMEILDGNHRARIWEDAGMTHAPAWVVDERGKGIENLSEDERAERAEIEAEENKPVTPFEKIDLSKDIPNDEAVKTEVPISKLSVSNKAYGAAESDIAKGRGSKTEGPIQVFYNPDNKQFLVADGMHRVVEAHQKGVKTLPAQLWSGYSDYIANVHPEQLKNLGSQTEQAAVEPENPKLSADRISTRVPRGTKSTENPLGPEPLIINRAAVSAAAPRLAEKMADKVRTYDGVKIPANIKDPAKVLDRFEDHLSDNLRWIYNQVPEEQRQQNRKWYESAHQIGNDTAEAHGMLPRQGAGVIAAMSPQKDWDMNVSLTKRAADIHHTKGDFQMTPEMDTKGKQLGMKSADLKALLGDLKDKTYNQLTDPYEKAAWLRIYDETYNPRTFEKIDPGTGEPAGIRLNADGTPSKIAWGGLNEGAKAVSIMQDGSRENISKQLGVAHKVRSFYNNIIDPTNDQDVTIDTHAVAAAHMQPFSGNSKEVLDNFQYGGNAMSKGVRGSYPLYADAYRNVAKELGLKPRELQSVVWEWARDRFANFKDAKGSAFAKGQWDQVKAGKITADQARKAIADAAQKANDTTTTRRPVGKINALDFLGGMKNNITGRDALQQNMSFPTGDQ